jgi:hypothetical protein
MGLVMTLSKDIKHNNIEYLYAQCRDYLNVMLNVILLSVVRLNVVMLSVVAPFEICRRFSRCQSLCLNPLNK